jgi:peroxiredoxin
MIVSILDQCAGQSGQEIRANLEKKSRDRRNPMIQALKLLILNIMFTLTFSVIADDSAIKTLEIGQTAPDFSLEGIDGKHYTLESFKKARILVIIFTANHCPTAQAYEERIIQLVNDYKNKKVAVVAISSNCPEALRLDEMGYSDLGDTLKEMQIRARDRGFNFPYLYDGDTQSAAKAYGPVTTPHVFIFDETRTLRYVGRMDDSENPANVTAHNARNAVEALLNDEKVRVEKTKTFGCSIKWAYKKTSVAEAMERWNREPVELEKIELNEIPGLIRDHSENLKLINIWATWCGPCVAEFSELIEINRMYRNRDFEMITVSADPPVKFNKILEFLKKNHASTKNYLCNSEDKYQLIEAVDKDWQGALPYTLLVKPGGEIIYRKSGMIDALELKKAIVETLGRTYF